MSSNSYSGRKTKIKQKVQKENSNPHHKNINTLIIDLKVSVDSFELFKKGINTEVESDFSDTLPVSIFGL